MKILWIERKPNKLGRLGARLRVFGRRLDGPGFFRARFDRVGGGAYASIVDVPAPGCWRISLQSGTVRGKLTLIAV